MKLDQLVRKERWALPEHPGSRDHRASQAYPAFLALRENRAYPGFREYPAHQVQLALLAIQSCQPCRVPLETRFAGQARRGSAFLNQRPHRADLRIATDSTLKVCNHAKEARLAPLRSLRESPPAFCSNRNQNRFEFLRTCPAHTVGSSDSWCARSHLFPKRCQSTPAPWHRHVVRRHR